MNFEAKVYDVPGEVKSPYVGDPRPELDQAWHNLLQGNDNFHFRIPWS